MAQPGETMPSVEYGGNTLVWEAETREVTDPETGETVERDIEHEQRPFEVRISKWLERSDGYHVHGFVEVTEFGRALADQPTPHEWVTEEFETAEGVTEGVVSEWGDGIAAVQATELDVILAFGGVAPEYATVIKDSEWRMDFEVVLSGATTFEIDWLSVEFEPDGGGN